MQANRSVSAPEIIFRRALWADGSCGFRRGVRLPGKPDVIFSAARVAIFVNGCYWHRCPICRLPEPQSNADFWRSKFKANLRRDEIAVSTLAAAGWTVMTVWEHEIRNDVARAARRTNALVAEMREVRRWTG